MQPFVPQPLPPSELDWGSLIPRIGAANRGLAHYGGILEALPNPALLLAPLTTQEAVLSSRIEGTQATLGDVLRFEACEMPLGPERADDIREVLNYRKALLAGEQELGRRSWSLNLLKTLHQMLLSGVRGKDKTPGAFRTEQNFIGEPGSPIEAAKFVPPIPASVPGHMDAWATYYRGEERDPLVQLALVHAQFEIIHPFNDGNGRIGRMLIPLFLYERKLLSRPTFYLSAWFEQRRDEYIARLRALGRESRAWEAWCDFFLRAVEEESRRNADVARAILVLYEDLKRRVIDLTRSQFAVPLLDQIFERPIFTSTDLDLGPRAPTKAAVGNLLRALREGGVLKVLREGAGRRSWIYAQAELLNLAEGKQVF
jgi:Fic family protein